MEAGDFAGAESALRAASVAMMMSRKGYHRELAEVTAALAWLYDRTGRPERALDYYPRAIQQAAAAGMLRCEFGVKMCERYALLASATGRHEAAVAACRQALVLAQGLHEGPSARDISIQELLGSIHEAAGSPAEAATAWRMALSLCSRERGPSLTISEWMRSLSSRLAGLYTQYPSLRAGSILKQHGPEPLPAEPAPVQSVTLKTTMITPRNEVFSRPAMLPAREPARQLRPPALRGTEAVRSVALTTPHRPAMIDEPAQPIISTPAAARTPVTTGTNRPPRIQRRRILPDGAPDLFEALAPHYE